MSAPPGRAQKADKEEEVSRTQLFVLSRALKPSDQMMALPSKFTFPGDARTSSTFGIDFSHYDEDRCKCTLDWTMLPKQRIGFAYLKASQGATLIDSAFAANADESLAVAGLRVGAYHFFSATRTADAQIKNFQTAIGKRAFTLPAALDLEWDPGPAAVDCPQDATIRFLQSNGKPAARCDRWRNVSGRDIVDKANTWLDAIAKATGQKPIVYTQEKWWSARIGKAAKVSDLHADVMWVADYSSSNKATETPAAPVGATWKVWQFTDHAVVEYATGKTLAMDGSILAGSLEDAFGKTTPH
jgi:lysozyme